MDRLDLGEQFAFSFFTGILSGLLVLAFSVDIPNECVIRNPGTYMAASSLLVISIAFILAIYRKYVKKNKRAEDKQ
ncbi:MAG: hypothetical protein ACTTH5_05000 [Wolinella sp.]